MSISLGFVFWGLLLALMDFRIGGFDLLPDVIGYVLLSIGCGRLAGESGNFKVAMVLAGILAVCGLFPAANLRVLQVPLLTILEIWQVWYTLAGIIRMAEARGLPEFASSALKRRRDFLVVTTLGVVLPLLYGRSWGREETSMILSILLLVAGLVVSIRVLLLVYRGKARFGHAQVIPGLAG